MVSSVYVIFSLVGLISSNCCNYQLCVGSYQMSIIPSVSSLLHIQLPIDHVTLISYRYHKHSTYTCKNKTLLFNPIFLSLWLLPMQFHPQLLPFCYLTHTVPKSYTFLYFKHPSTSLLSIPVSTTSVPTLVMSLLDYFRSFLSNFLTCCLLLTYCITTRPFFL